MKQNQILALALMCGSCSVALGQAPTDYWTFDADLTSNGTAANAGVAVGDGISITTVASERIRGVGALKIDHATATADYVSIPTPVFPEFLTLNGRPEAFTVAMWYKLDPNLGPNDTRNFLFETKPDDALGIGTRSPEEDMEWFLGAVATDQTGPLVGDNAWHHIAFVYDKAGQGLITYYHDGQVRDVVRLGLGQFFSDGPFDPIGDAASLGDSQEQGMNIGNHRAGDGSRNWQGFIDDFAIWDVALGPAQVQALYQGSVNGTTITPLNVTGVVGFDNQTLLSFLPNFDPTPIEAGWSLSRTVRFPGAAGLAYDSSADILYAGRRFQGADNGATLFGFDGLYKVERNGTVTQLAGGDRLAGIALTPDSNSVLWCEDFAGFIYRSPVTGGEQLWADGFYPTGDVDPTTVNFVPAGFDASSFGLDSQGLPFLRGGQAMCVDRGNGGADEVYVWDGSAANLSVAVNPDLTTNFDQVLLADGALSLDGDGVAYADVVVGGATVRNSPLANPTDVAFGPNVVYLADAGTTIGGSIWRVTGPDTLTKLDIVEPLRPTALDIDPVTGDLIVLDRNLGNGQTRVLRINPATGATSTIIAGIGGFTGDTNNGGYGAMALSADGTKLFVSDELMLRIYEFRFAGTCPADINGDGNVDPDDLSDYIACFFTPPCDRADFNRDGNTDPDDLSDYISVFFSGAGC